LLVPNDLSSGGTKDSSEIVVLSPLRGSTIFELQIPRLKPWAIFNRHQGAGN